jgi:hypothetical protein
MPCNFVADKQAKRKEKKKDKKHFAKCHFFFEFDSYTTPSQQLHNNLSH